MKNILSLIVFITFIGGAYALEPSDFNPIRKDLAEIKKSVADLTVKVDKIAEKVDKLVESPHVSKNDGRGKNCPNNCKCDSGGECRKDSNGNCICNEPLKVTPVQSSENRVVTAYRTERVCDGESCRTVQVPVYATTNRMGLVLKDGYDFQPQVYALPVQQYSTPIRYFSQGDCASGNCGVSQGYGSFGGIYGSSAPGQRFISLSDGPVRRAFRGLFGCGG